MSEQNVIQVGNLKISNALSFTLFGGMNVLESRELALEIAAAYKEITQKLGISYVFKSHEFSRTWNQPLILEKTIHKSSEKMETQVEISLPLCRTPCFQLWSKGVADQQALSPGIQSFHNGCLPAHTT